MKTYFSSTLCLFLLLFPDNVFIIFQIPLRYFRFRDTLEQTGKIKLSSKSPYLHNNPSARPRYHRLIFSHIDFYLETKLTSDRCLYLGYSLGKVVGWVILENHQTILRYYSPMSIPKRKLITQSGCEKYMEKSKKFENIKMNYRR